MLNYIGKIIETEEGYKIEANKNDLLAKTLRVKHDFIDTYVDCNTVGEKTCEKCPLNCDDEFYGKGCLYCRVSRALDLIIERIEEHTIESED